jgi:hypothetical protein
MPGLDGTGPVGMGPMTGGRRGWCNPYTVNRYPARRAYASAFGLGRPRWGVGRGVFGRGRGIWGRGRGRGRRF